LVRNVGIVVFDDVEELDFTGPLEVFGSAAKLDHDSFRVFTVGVGKKNVKGVNGLQAVADYTLDTCPRVDILVVPGGRGTRRLMHDSGLLRFVQEASKTGELVTSVCTGALILASAGLLEGKKATTHHSALEELAKFPKVEVVKRRYVRQGKVITAAGISAGIDMALFVVRSLHGPGLARDAQADMEYHT
jgi:cyclohexyl-isocyanide hydratase